MRTVIVVRFKKVFIGSKGGFIMLRISFEPYLVNERGTVFRIGNMVKVYPMVCNWIENGEMLQITGIDMQSGMITLNNGYNIPIYGIKDLELVD